MSEETKEKQRKFKIRINPPVFLSSAVLILVFVLFTMFNPARAERIFEAVQNWIIIHAGWFYILAVAFFLIFVVYLAFSKKGHIKLGPDHSTPDFSYLSWFAMLFSAGMGIGLLFFSVAEPVMHYMDPPALEGGTVEAAREAMKITFFHWGVHAWAIYAVMALSLAYFSFRHNLPIRVRSAFYPIIGDRINGPIGHVIDSFAVIATLFGVATSLGVGVLQVNAGLHYIFGIAHSTGVQITLIVIITLFATGSVVSGLDKGIRRISELNITLALLLLIFVLFMGPTLHILQTLVQNVGNYVSDVVEQTFHLYAYDPGDWIGGWTLFYWGWWISWSPFVGMFVARVSRGRTIREFVIGVLMVPVGFTFVWMTFFGNTAIDMIMNRGITQLYDAVAADEAVAMFQFFEHLPFSMVVSVLATILIITFFITSSDSGSLVIDMMTNNVKQEGPVWQRVFWAFTEGAVAIALLLAGGLEALQTGAIASALPFTIILLFICGGLFRALQKDVIKQKTCSNVTLTDSSTASFPWQKRLQNIIHYPGKEDVLDFIKNTVRPAMEEVAAVFEKNGIKTEVEEGEDGRVWIKVLHQEEDDFFYSVRPTLYNTPTFMYDNTEKDDDEQTYYRAEVYLKEGGQNYDLMGWAKEQIINNIIDQYETHIHYLNIVR